MLSDKPAPLKGLYKHHSKKMMIWENPYTQTVRRATSLLASGGKAIVTPTKVGYIIMTVDKQGLEKKFFMKGRPKTKPGVVLCTSLEQIQTLAHVDSSIMKLYQECWNKDLLLGCILPWQKKARDKYVPQDGSKHMIQDIRETSCFVIKYGDPSERIAKLLWENENKLAFASSANPSGKGNRGKLKYVGSEILSQADLLLFGDSYVERQQPGKTTITRWEQGVMVSMVDTNGNLIDVPEIIRQGLSLEQIMFEMSRIYNSFDYRHGAYH